MDLHQSTETVSTAVAASAAALHLDVLAVEVRPAGGDVRIVVLADRMAGRGGITLDECAALSLAIQARLDVHVGLADRYELEVSSPGLDRPLRHLDDCARFVGVDVRLAVRAPAGDAAVRFGTLIAVDRTEGTLDLRLPAAKGTRAGHDLHLAWGEVQSARLAPTVQQWQALGARLAAETPHVALDQTGDAEPQVP